MPYKFQYLNIIANKRNQRIMMVVDMIIPIAFEIQSGIFYCAVSGTVQTILEIYFIKQQYSLIEIIVKTNKTNLMLYWCHSCSKITLPARALKCQYCSSDAIEEIQENNNPSQYIPPSVQSVQVSSHQQPTNQTTQQVIDENEDPFARLLSLFRPQRVMVRAYFPEPVFSFLRVIHFPEEEQRKSVNEDKIKQLQKIQSLSHECAVCQEREGSGLRLACKHEFHQNCIKPWFNNSNTCPCCRSVV